MLAARPEHPLFSWWRKVGPLVERIILRRYLWLTIVVLCLLAPHTAARAQNGDRAVHPVVSSKLVSRDTGWVVLMRNFDCSPGMVVSPCSPKRLYWTEDNGKHWRNITPSRMPTRNIQQVFFVDSLHGWMLSSDALGDEANASFFLFSTKNGGKSWRTLVLHRPTFQMMDDYTFPSDLFFLDSKRGWMVWGWGMMHSRKSYLLATKDGGRTWKRLPDPPVGTSVQFTSPLDGWMVATSGKDRGVPTPEDDGVWRTSDGGQHWCEIDFPLPTSRSESLDFTVLKFSNRDEGVLLGETLSDNDDGERTSYVWATHDGGRTWHLSMQQPPLADDVSIVNSEIILSSRSPDFTIRANGQLIRPSLPTDLRQRARLGPLDFADHTNAWLTAYPALLATTDGGISFDVILPSSGEPEWEPQPEIVAVNGIPQVGFSREQIGLPSSAAGRPIVIHGRGFLPENTVLLGAHKLQTQATDSSTLSFTVPADLTTRPYTLRVQNAEGKSDPVQVFICAAGPPEILEVHSGMITSSGDTAIRHGWPLELRGCGFRNNSQVWFGTIAADGRLSEIDDMILHVDVPTSLSSATYQVYMTNANGKSMPVPVVVQ